METNSTSTYLYRVINDGDWKDDRCYIVGGGNTLEGFDFEILKDRGRVIAVNQSFLKVPFADMLVSMDSRYFRWIQENTLGSCTQEAFNNFKGIKVWINTEMDKIDYNHKVYILEHTGSVEVCKKMKDGVWTGGNSGFSALQIAAVLGCNPIYLLGFDMKEIGGKTHHHPEYPERTDPQAFQTVHPKAFIRTADKFKELGIKVININQPDTTALHCFPFGKIVLEQPIYVSFYTPEYKSYADNLEASLRRFGLKYEIRQIQSLGKWEKNCNFKPVFIAEMMEKYNSPIVWLDADATVESYPTLFDNTLSDIAVHFRNGHELLSGTVFFNHTTKSKDLIRMWCNESMKKPNELDQDLLRYAMSCWDGKVKRLPDRYCNIFDLMNIANPVITHWQASRKYRKVV